MSALDDDEMEASKAPLMDHLKELRKRLLISVGALVIGFFIAFAFAEQIYTFLAGPLVQAWGEDLAGRRMIFTAPQEWFFTQMKVAFFASFCFTFPLIASQMWAFIAPGLYRHERQAFLPFLLATPFLFILGSAFVYYLVMPVALTFFLGFEQSAMEGVRVEMEAKVSEYLSFAMTLIFAFGLCFELPVLLTLLVKVGITSSKSLKEKRRYAILIAFVAAAILTPPDPLSQIGLAVPIILLYEISIWCATLIEASKRRRDKELGIGDDDEEDDDDEDEESAEKTEEGASKKSKSDGDTSEYGP